MFCKQLFINNFNSYCNQCNGQIKTHYLMTHKKLTQTSKKKKNGNKTFIYNILLRVY